MIGKIAIFFQTLKFLIGWRILQLLYTFLIFLRFFEYSRLTTTAAG